MSKLIQLLKNPWMRMSLHCEPQNRMLSALWAPSTCRPTYAGLSFQTTGFRIHLIHELSWSWNEFSLPCSTMLSNTRLPAQRIEALLLTYSTQFLPSIPIFLPFLELPLQRLRKKGWSWEGTSPCCQGRECRSAQPKMVQKKWGQRRHSGVMERGHLKVV